MDSRLIVFEVFFFLHFVTVSNWIGNFFFNVINKVTLFGLD